MDLIRILLVYMSLLTAQGAVSDAVPVQVTQMPVVQVTATATLVPTAAPSPTPAPTAVPTYYAALSEGSRGDKVKRLQQALIDLGYLTGRADGAYGAMTRNAVTEFQKANGLIADGIAGSATQWLLYEGTPVARSAATPTPAVTAEAAVPATVRIVYEDQFGNIFSEAELQITHTLIVRPDDERVPEGYDLTSAAQEQVLYTRGRAYPATVTFRYHSPFIPSSIEVPVYYVTFDNGERQVLYETSVVVTTGSYAAVTADPGLVPGYRLKSASRVTVAADEEANVAPSQAEFVFTRQ